MTNLSLEGPQRCQQTYDYTWNAASYACWSLSTLAPPTFAVSGGFAFFRGPPFFDRECIMHIRVPKRFNAYTDKTHTNFCLTLSAAVSPVQAGKATRRRRISPEGMLRHSGRLCGTDVEVVCTRIRGVRSSVVHFSQLSSRREGSRIYLIPLLTIVTFPLVPFARSLLYPLFIPVPSFPLSPLRIY